MRDDFAAAFSIERINAMRSSYAPKSLAKADLLADQFLLVRDRQLNVFYAPFDTMPAGSAKIVFVGLTPGLTQVQRAASLFQSADPRLRDDAERYRELFRNAVAFAGSMRSNLCTMLDALGLHEHLGLERCAMMFDGHDAAIATTSALVYPVFVGADRSNYSGSGRPLGDVALFKVMLEELLQPRLQAAPSALIVPLGDASASGIRYLVSTQAIDERRVLFGFPHPSGANGHRKVKFDAERATLIAKLDRWFDRG